MAKHLVLVGGGHAHLTALLRLGDFVGRGHRVTLISPSPYHYYSGVGPGMLSGIYRPEEARFHIKKMAKDRGASFVPGTAVRIDPEERVLFLGSGNKVQYDIISFNIGSHVAAESMIGYQKKAFPVKPVENLLRAREAILHLERNEESKIVVVGGGPSGLEIAGNTWRLINDNGLAARIKLIAGSRLLARFPERVRRLAMESLTRRGIEVVEDALLARLEDGRAHLENGHMFPYDIIFLALGIRPPGLFRDSGLRTGEDGGLLVNDYLQSVDRPEIFGGGDCISFRSRPLDKVGVYAVRQNPILHHNLMTALEGGGLLPFEPQGIYLLIFSLGDGTGIFCRKNQVWNGRLSFWLKDYIDRRFMRRFQVSGERESASAE